MIAGLTDDVLDTSKFNISGLNANALGYEELRLAFLPEDREKFDKALAAIKNDKRVVATYGVRLGDFDTVFDAAVTIKQRTDIQNTALAFLAMAELALAKLEENDTTP